MSFNIEWTNADALTPSPFTVTKDGCHFEVKVDAHYVSDEEVETVRRYIDSLHRENAKLREQLEGIVGRSFRTADKMSCLEAENAKLRELVRDYERCTMHADCAGCEYDGKLSTHCPLSPCFPDAD